MADNAAVDTSVLVAALVVEHDHHDLAVPPTVAADHVFAQALAEAWSVLRRRFRLSADDTARLLLSYRQERALLAPPASAYDDVLRTGRALQLAGDVHDAVIVRTAASAGVSVTTIDRGLHRLADGVVACDLLTA